MRPFGGGGKKSLIGIEVVSNAHLGPFWSSLTPPGPVDANFFGFPVVH